MVYPPASSPKETEEVIGEPIVVGERSIRPVSQIRRGLLSFQAPGRAGGGLGEIVRMIPREALVREGDGREYRLPLADPTGKTLRLIALVALLMPVLSRRLVRLFRKAFSHKE